MNWKGLWKMSIKKNKEYIKSIEKENDKLWGENTELKKKLEMVTKNHEYNAVFLDGLYAMLRSRSLGRATVKKIEEGQYLFDMGEPFSLDEAAEAATAYLEKYNKGELSESSN